MPAARNVGITNVIISIIIRFYKSSLSCYFTDARSFRYLLQKCLEEMSPLFAEGRNSTWRIAAHEGSSAERTREIIWLDIDQIARAGQHGQRSVRAESIGQFRRESSLTGPVQSGPGCRPLWRASSQPISHQRHGCWCSEGCVEQGSHPLIHSPWLIYHISTEFCENRSSIFA